MLTPAGALTKISTQRTAYHARGTLRDVGSRFSFTEEGLTNVRLYDVTPGEVWEALHGRRRVIRHLGDDVLVVYAATRRGRRLAILLAEVDQGDHDWDVLAARELSDVEAKRYDEAVQRQL
jgi:hypothetical protein